jgi:hypothetical protein
MAQPSPSGYVFFLFLSPFKNRKLRPWLPKLLWNGDELPGNFAVSTRAEISMLNTLKRLMRRFSPKTEIDHQVIAPTGTQQKNCEEPVKYLPAVIQANSFEVSQRISDELHSSDISARRRDRAYMDKWLQRGELTNSGSFRIAEMQQRMEEFYEREDELIASLPAQEDILLAFSKPELDLFGNDKLSLSGVFLKVDPNEDFDEQYTTPLLPMYNAGRNASADRSILLGESSSPSENYDLNFAPDVNSAEIPTLKTLLDEISIEDSTLKETLEELIKVVNPVTLPEPVPAFIKCDDHSAGLETRQLSKIDPSALFEEWTNDLKFEPAACAATPSSDSVSSESVSFDSDSIESVKSDSLESISSEAAKFTPTEIDCTATLEVETITDQTAVDMTALKLVTNPTLSLVEKQSASYWSESDRLTRFGRRKTSGSCSSTKSKVIGLDQLNVSV